MAINTKEIDRFRQGQYASSDLLIERRTGLPVINSSLGSSIIEENVFGQIKTFPDNTAFVDQSNFNVVDYINDSTYSYVFPAILGNINIRDLNQLNGIIEPISIRPVASLNSINYPHDPNRVYGTLESGEEDTDNRSSFITSKYIKSEVTYIPFLEMSNTFIDKDNFYTSDIKSYITPFDDTKQNRIKLKQKNTSTEITGDDVRTVILSLNNKDDNFISENEYVYSTGFNYEGSVNGIDSIAFGGLGN